MNKKEVLEIKKQLIPINCNLSRIAGCFVTSEKERAFSFNKRFLSLPDEEMFSYLDLFRKGLSGRIGKTLLQMDFPTKVKNEKQDLLMKLRETRLENEEILDDFFNKVIMEYELDDSYMILIVHGDYDIPGKTESFTGDVYSYLMCILCPLKLDKAGLACNSAKCEIEQSIRNMMLNMPMHGFLFPTFDDRSENLHSLLYYTKKSDALNTSFIENMFGTKYMLAADEQKTAFSEALESVDISFEGMKTLKEKSEELMLDDENLKLDAGEMEKLVESCTSSGHGLSDLLKQQGAKEVILSNVISPQKTTITTDSIEIRLDNENLGKIEVRSINGMECIVIIPDGKICVDGVPVKH